MTVYVTGLERWDEDDQPRVGMWAKMWADTQGQLRHMISQANLTESKIEGGSVHREYVWLRPAERVATMVLNAKLSTEREMAITFHRRVSRDERVKRDVERDNRKVEDADRRETPEDTESDTV